MAQDAYCDSLLRFLPAQKEDTNKVLTLYRLCSCYYYDDPKMAINYGKQALVLAEKLEYKKGIASSCNNLGIAYDNIGEFEKAAKLFFRSMKLKEELGNLASLASVYGNLGGVFYEQGNIDKAEEYHKKSLAIGEKLHDKSILAYAYQNLGILELDRENKAAALMYCRNAANLFYAIGDSLNYSNNLNNMGVVYFKSQQYDSSEKYYRKALLIRINAGDNLDMVNSYNNMAGLFIAYGNFEEAEKNYLLALNIGFSLGTLPYLKNTYSGLAAVYDSLHDYKSAYHYQGLYIQLSDSISSMNSKKDLAVLELKYQQEKKDKEDAIRLEAEAKEQKLIYVFLSTILIIISVFSIFLFNRFRTIRRQKKVIESKTKEIVDSINYAQRLQEAILPPQKLIKQLLPESFVLYRPKDIVAGDFYWLENFRNKIFFAAADCTGHGVPGAMVSIVCSNALTRCVKEFGIDEPGKILDKVRELVIQTFERSESDVKDGMDIALCCLEKEKMELKFSGANNSLWITRKKEMLIWNADHQPIGKFEMAKPFTTHTVKLEKGDCIYLGTDGYSDQFGGDKGKKFKTANIKSLLLTISNRPLLDQNEILEMTFDTWKGDLEQVDDVCVMGVKM